MLSAAFWGASACSAGYASVLVLSRRISQELLAFHADFRRYPLQVMGAEGTERDVVQILRAGDCIDLTRSELTLLAADDPDREDRAGHLRTIVRLVIDPGRAGGLDIFRLTKAPHIIVVSDRVKRLMEWTGATGCEFTQVSGLDATGTGSQGASSGPGDPVCPSSSGLSPTKEHFQFGHLTLVRDWFLKPPRRPPPRPAIPKLHDHDIDMHLMGVSAACLGKAAKFDLKGTLEAQVGASFSSWLSDRRAAFALKMATRDWIAAQCEECLAGFPHAEAGKTRDQVRAYATEDVFWELVCQEYGEDRAIALRNLAFGDPELHAEFRAEGSAASPRDFSFLLDRLEASARG